MSGLEQKAIKRLKLASEMSMKLYQQPLIITDSGGKDSAVCKALAARAGISYEVLHSHTTADAPETVYFLSVRSLSAWRRPGLNAQSNILHIRENIPQCGR